MISDDVSDTETDPYIVDLINGEILLNTNTKCYLSLLDTKLQGKFTLTNYKFNFKSKTDNLNLNIPLGFILKIEKIFPSTNSYSINTGLSNSSDPIGLVIWCKNGRKFQFLKFEQDLNFDLLIHDQLVKFTFYNTNSSECFAYLHKPLLSDNSGWLVYDAEKEYNRMGTGDKWRLSTINENYKLCETYPKVLCVPSFASDVELELVAQFRSKNRLPVLSWMSQSKNYTPILRSSQPLIGIAGKRSIHDENYLKNIASMCSSNTTPKGHIFDARPYINALANCTNGGGYENERNYEFYKVEFLKIENIHTMRDCLGVFTFNVDSKWLEHLKLILDGSIKICEKINLGFIVLVHCSDGWDRTSQLTSLAMLQMDWYYRTLEGFQVLIEKEWLSFGHKFSSRVGHGCDKYMDQDRSPIFVQFIDCVWQIMAQNDFFFEFNEYLLIEILEALYSNQYGTFLMDSECEREKFELKTKTVSLWSFINSNKDKYLNKNFIVYDGDLKFEIDKLKIWESYYFKDVDKRFILKDDQQTSRTADGEQVSTYGNFFGTLKNNQASFNNLLSNGIRYLNTMLDKN
ncbi:unnamed protein product [Brachionus calyciflorus]|uniref:Myotubularin phosphatase domain-containing protein n=1 Tax=Brachionus calyciflorus TaxID=104777 RepID=A0A813QC80_9BILA|nr:unnamed protein product [Brachionus calyciflorus]